MLISCESYFFEKEHRTHNTGYTSGGFESSLQAPGSLARAVTVDNESATKTRRCIPSTLVAGLTCASQQNKKWNQSKSIE